MVSKAVASVTYSSMMAPSEIEQMSIEERLQAIEQLWESVARLGGAVESPAWHGAVLAARRAKVEAGEGQFLSLSELRDRLKPSP
jgi:putative addiction module component (TIGR02574 family)